MSVSALKPRLQTGLEALQLELSGSQVDQLLKYGDLILKWNKVYNLSAIRNADDLLTHHLLDSLAVVKPLRQSISSSDPTPRVLDVGSGAGLPGIVLAIVHPEWTVHTLDTVQKKAMFMQQAMATLGLVHAKSFHNRVEEFAPDERYSLICSRAFSSLNNFIQWSAHLLSDQGLFAAMKGRLETDQSVPPGWQIQSIHRLEVPFLPDQRHLFLIKR